MTNPYLAPHAAVHVSDPSQPDPEERMGVEQIRAIQLQRLKWSIHHAYENVPAYRTLYDGAGVHPDDLRELEDLARFPFTDKEFLRNN